VFGVSDESSPEQEDPRASTTSNPDGGIRRQLLVGSAALAGGVAGCNTGTDTPEGTGASSPTASTPAATPTDDTNTPTETPDGAAWNGTKYPGLRQTLDGCLKGGEVKPAVYFLTNDGWRDLIREDGLDEESRAFVEDTDFAREWVLAFEAHLSSAGNHWTLKGVRGVGGERIEAQFEQEKTDGGLDAMPLRLLLVRVPNDGVEPARGVAKILEDPSFPVPAEVTE
jgi:hypothetical protein